MLSRLRRRDWTIVDGDIAFAKGEFTSDFVGVANSESCVAAVVLVSNDSGRAIGEDTDFARRSAANLRMPSSVGDAVTNLTNSSTPMVFLTSVSAEVSRACACASTSSASETGPVDFMGVANRESCPVAFVGGDSGRVIGAGVGFFGGAGGGWMRCMRRSKARSLAWLSAYITMLQAAAQVKSSQVWT